LEVNLPLELLINDNLGMCHLGMCHVANRLELATQEPRMDPILDAYAKLKQDRADLDLAYAAKATTSAAVTTANNADSVAASDLTAGIVRFDADKAALVKLIQDNITNGPPVQ
jgi:hypothetical protein